MPMTDRQATFFRALLMPFGAECYGTVPRGGRSLTYLKPRAIMNRLDEICGPTGWCTEYHDTSQGQRCRLKILCPDHTPDGWAWMHKEDGAGREDMGRNTQDGWEVNVDDSEKASYTNAFRRAAGVWGFGRELYQEGVPSWIADLHAEAPVRQSPPRGGGPTRSGEGEYPARGQRDQDFSPPTRPGKAMFAWIKNMEAKYQADGRLLDGAIAFLKKQGMSPRTDQLNEHELKILGQKCVEYIRTWDEYDGIFDNQARTPGLAGGGNDELGNLKRAIMAAATSWAQSYLGRQPETSEVVAAVGDLAAAAVSGKGHKGEVLTSLKDCNDRAWLQNILTECQRQIQRAAYAATEVGAKNPGVEEDADDIPF